MSHKTHRCKEMATMPKSTQIEFDSWWGWCWTTPQVIEYIEFCCYCGVRLAKPSKP